MSDAEVLARVEGSVGRITLNRPQAINALTLGMVRLIAAALDAWEDDPAVRTILIDGAGPRGFCAGGDIRALWDAVRAGEDLPAVFWSEEYRLNLRIHRSARPVIAVMDGIVMGGGVGLSAHAAHRVVTGRTTIAMPETGIGFIPDVGGTHLLSRAPGEIGTHLGLTAGRCGAGDAILCGLADLFIPEDRLAQLPAVLQGAADGEQVRAALGSLAEAAPTGPLAAARRWIEPCYAHDTAEAILAALLARDEPDAQAAAASIRRNAPASVKVTLRALREAPALGGLGPCLERELRLAMACTRRPDFVEGVRAQVVDKDRSPRWTPDTLEAVGPGLVDWYFAAAAAGKLVLAVHT